MTTRTAGWAGAVLAVVGLAGVAFLLAHLLAFGFGRDQAIYAVVAAEMLDGGAPYRDAWDFKPPGIFFVYALAGIASTSPLAVRVLEAFALLSLFPAFGILSKRWVGSVRAGWVGAGFAIVAYVPLEFWNTAQPEGFGGVALAWALVAAGSGRLAVIALGAGFFAAAALLKPPLGGGIVIAFGASLAVARRVGPSSSLSPWRVTAAYVAGGALPVFLVIAFFSWKGALADLYEAQFVFAPRYVALTFEASELPAYGLRAVREWLFDLGPYNLLGLASALALPRLHAKERGGTAVVLGVVAFTLFGVALQAKFFPYHYATAVILTGLPAGWGAWKVWVWATGSRWRWLLPTLALVVLTAWGLPGGERLREFWERSQIRHTGIGKPVVWQAAKDQLHSGMDSNALSNRLAAEWIDANTDAEARLFVWGFEPTIYLETGRRPASRYFYNVPQRSPWLGERSRAIQMRELRSDPPEAVVVLRNDRLRYVTGTKGDSRAALERFPEFKEFLRDGYIPSKTIGDLQIWLRRP